MGRGKAQENKSVRKRMNICQREQRSVSKGLEFSHVAVPNPEQIIWKLWFRVAAVMDGKVTSFTQAMGMYFQ